MIESTFWRTEIWHPLSVHFPIALLALATAVKLFALFLKPASAEFWQKAGSFLLYTGSLAAWVSIFTGDLAEGIVARTLCDPTVLKDHEIYAEYLAYTFTIGALLDVAQRYHAVKIRARFLQILVVLLLLAGSGFMAYAGHLGASVVYQQAGGVNVPSGDCAEFSR